jgi:hypothetical protein
MCFAWAVLSALHPSGKHSEMISKYRPYLKSIDLSGLKFPMPVNQVARFEKNNPTISVNVYGLGEDEEEIIPKHVTMLPTGETRRSLTSVVEKSDNFHYTCIKNLSALIYRRSNHKEAMYVCPHCVHPFSSTQAFDSHFPDCSKHVYQVTRYPDPESEESIVKWKSRDKTERVPFVIYADFASCLVPESGKIGVMEEHFPSEFCAYTMSVDPEFETEPVLHSGRDCMDVFYDHLANEQGRIAAILKDCHERGNDTIESRRVLTVAKRIRKTVTKSGITTIARDNSPVL